MTDQEPLSDIQNAFDATVIEEIFEAYVKSGIEPSERLVKALGVLCGKSDGEVHKWFDQRLRSK